MSRIATATTLPQGDVSISSSFTLGACPYNQPLPSGINLTYSVDDRTLKHSRLIQLTPYIEVSTQHYLVTEYEFENPCQNNIMLMNYGIDLDTIKTQTGTIRFDVNDYDSTSDKAYVCNYGSRDGTWMPRDTAPTSDYYENTYVVTDFRYNKVALFPFVEIDYRNSDNSVSRTTHGNIGIYDYFNMTQQEKDDLIPSGATFKGLYFGYKLMYSRGSDCASGTDYSSNTYKMYLAGMIPNFKEGESTKHFNREFSDIIENDIGPSYSFAYNSFTLLGSSRPYSDGRFGDFISFIGKKSNMYIEHLDSQHYFDDRGKVIITTQGYGYEDALAAALSKGLIVVETRNQAENFENFTWDDFIQYHIDDHVLKAKRDGSRITSDFVRGSSVEDDTDVQDSVEGKNPYEETHEYDPDDPDDVDPNDYVNETPLTDVPNFLNPVGKFTRFFALSEEGLEDFTEFLSPNADNVWDDIKAGLALYGENPMDFIISLRMFPFDITTYCGQMPTEITFGRRVHTGVTADRITDANIVIDMGSCYFRRYYKNYLDYEPYCTAKLYIPYCGEVSIPTSVFLGHTINVKMVVDLSTGSCIAIIFKDGIAAYSVNGQIGVEIPVTGINGTEYVKACINMLKGALSSATSIASNGALMGKTGFTETTGSPTNTPVSNIQHGMDRELMSNRTTTHQWSTGGIAGGIAQGLEVAYEFRNIPTPLEVSGASMPFNSFYKPQYCYFVVQQCIPMEPSGYGDTIGYACLEKRKLTVNDTYIVAHNPNVQPANATSPETNEINQLLATGVWV